MKVSDIISRVDYLKSSWTTKTYGREQLGLNYPTSNSTDPDSPVISEEVFKATTDTIKKQLSSPAPQKAKPASFEIVGKEE